MRMSETVMSDERDVTIFATACYCLLLPATASYCLPACLSATACYCLPSLVDVRVRPAPCPSPPQVLCLC